MGFEQALRVKEAQKDRLLGFSGVGAVDVGYRWRAGRLRTDEVCVRVWVEAKGDPIPAGEFVPGDLDGVATDVVERRLELKGPDTVRWNALVGGVSVGPCRDVGGGPVAGTLGAVVVDSACGDLVGLTNWHVAVADDAGGEGDRMVQPSRLDGGSCPDDEVGALVRSRLDERVDAAVVSLTGREITRHVRGIGVLCGVAVPELGMEVRKSGRTTDTTTGMVDGLEASVRVDYGPGFGVRQLEGQISLTGTDGRPFGQGGDSGSVVVTGDGRAVGLYFAGDRDGTNGIANTAADVAERLAITFTP
ncbi:chymotrypsin family serine protease [Salininema proteolyticum]|uniref:Trypsin-like peptidase domain-containing protein n=1 Tax=Salininema proteolyticum TaxID=1607685 RepID=A0ABV8TUY4_9ACTN